MVDVNKMIDNCITNDEGGWVLTANKNDPDGGWTYAGCTKNTIDLVFGDKYLKMPFIQAQHYHPSNDEIYQIYTTLFLNPLQLETWPEECHAAMFSCAVNRGPENAIKAAQAALNGCVPDGKIGSQTIAFAHSLKLNEFLREWTRQYILLVRDNARAWKDWGECESHVIENKFALQIQKPKVFRADSLEGWFNRVERYRV